MRTFILGFALVAALSMALPVQAGAISFETQSTATQTINSPLVCGAVSITAHGTQVFTLDPSTGFANVTSDFKGTDLPNPFSSGSFLSYDLYNTATTGSISQEMSGSYDITFHVLFELKVTTPGPLDGFTFETLQNATCQSLNIATLPFPPGTAFADPSPSDTLPIYVKVDPTGTFPPGTQIGTSSGRIVTINSIVPEPSSAVLSLIGAAGVGIMAWRRRRS
jgi:hypothetical protein